jgi:hypothetical protein
MTEDFDLVTMQVAEPAFGMQLGQAVLKVHPRSVCEGKGIPCCIHSPSEHHMRAWELNWRSDTGAMERFCPHGVGHPDPDHMAYVLSLTPPHDNCPNRLNKFRQYADRVQCQYPHLEWQEVHGCDGCCVPPEEKS